MAMMHPDDALRAARERQRHLRDEMTADRLAAMVNGATPLSSRLALRASDVLLALGMWLRSRADAGAETRPAPAAVAVLGGRWEAAPLLMLRLSRGRAVAASALWWPTCALADAPVGGRVGFALVPVAWLPSAAGVAGAGRGGM